MRQGDSLKARVDWVDFAKGMCIVFVVMLHSTMRVESAADQQGWMHYVIQFAKPFRMPDFFMISGLFLGMVIASPWRRYVDRKVIHFVYFYLLWSTIQTVVKTPYWMVGEGQTVAEVAQSWAWGLVQPEGTLWFIYMLPIFFVVTRLLRPVPWALLLAGAAVLEMLPIHTGSVLIDEFAARYVYFLAGYLLAGHIFELAEWARKHWALALGLIACWAVVNGILTFSPAPAALVDWVGPGYWSDMPVVSLMLGAAGAIAIILVSALVSRVRALAFMSWLGAHSIVVYLAFFFPMQVSRILLQKFAPGLDIGTISAIVTIIAVVSPVILYFLIERFGIGRFLFERPAWARLEEPAPLGQNTSGAYKKGAPALSA